MFLNALNILYNKYKKSNIGVALDDLYSKTINLEDKYEIKSIWEEITGTTEGTVTIYNNLSINQRKWFEGLYNGKVVSVTTTGEPEDKEVQTSSGETVKSIVEIDGTYTLSGLPTANRYGIVWQISGITKDFGLANIPENKIIAEYDDASPFTRINTDIQPLINSDNINLLNGGLKDSNVLTAVNLGDNLNTEVNTKNKTLIGAINEIIGRLSGGTLSPNPIYLTTTASTIVGTYKQLSYTMPIAQTILSTVVNNNEVLINTYIFDLAVEDTILPAGEWMLEFYGYVSQTTLTTKLKAVIFKRTSDGVETDLFTIESADINLTSVGEINLESYQNDISINATDYLGVRLYANTTAAINITVFTYIGDGKPSYIITPLSQVHDLLRRLKTTTDNVAGYLHLTNGADIIYGPKTFESVITANGGLKDTIETTPIKLSQLIFGTTNYGGSVVTNLDSISKNGFFTCTGTAIGTPSTDYSWFVIHQNSNVGTISATQRAVAYNSSQIISYERVKVSSTWGSWIVEPIDSALVHKSNDETITDIKTFSKSPIVPTPTTDMQVATKDYADKSNMIETATCTTAIGTSEKEVSLSEKLFTGKRFKIYFQNGNSATIPTLKVIASNTTISAQIIDETLFAVGAMYPFFPKAGTLVTFTYDGTNFVYENRIVRSYKDGSTWAKIWTNGYIQQGGFVATTSLSADILITFTLNFVDTNYDFNRSCHYYSPNSTAVHLAVGYKNLTAANITISSEDPAYADGYKWSAEGF